MVRRIVIATALVIAVAAVGWYLAARGRSPAARPPGSADLRGAGARPLLPVTAPGSGEPALPAAGEPPARPALDCDAPAGDAVRVGELTISADEVCRELRVMAGPPVRPPSEAWRAQARLVRDRLVDAALVHQALTGAGLAVSADEVDAALAAMSRARAPAAASIAGEAEVLRGQVRARLELARLVALRYPEEPTEAEVRAAYDQDPSAYGAPGKARVTPFARRLAAAASDDEVAAAAHSADEFLAAVASGTPAAEAAATFGLVGLPPFVLEERGVEPELRAAAFGVAPGSWTAPVRTRIGWVTVRVEEVRAGKLLPFDRVREQVRTALVARRDQDHRAALVRELRAGTTIVDAVGW